MLRRSNCVLVLLDVAVCQSRRVFASLAARGDDLVVHVGEVHDVTHLVALVFQVAADEIEHDRRHRVPDVCVRIDGGAANVHPHFAGFQGLERFFFTRQGVVDDQRHVCHLIAEGRRHGRASSVARRSSAQHARSAKRPSSTDI